eukprot:m.341595 g.341595  ORF g.341595 m.341595 type:complete len:188 (-) comp20612_c0_seq9:2439-3002(-)
MEQTTESNRIVYLDHDPWAMPSDPEEDLYPDHVVESDDSEGEESSSDVKKRPLSLMQTTELTAEELTSAPVQVKSIDVASEKVILYNQTNDDVNLQGWYVKALAAGKTSAPFPSTVLAGQSEIILWTAPGVRNSTAPQEEDDSNLIWRNKNNGKIRRLALLARAGDAIELYDQDDVMVHMKYTETEP